MRRESFPDGNFSDKSELSPSPLIRLITRSTSHVDMWYLCSSLRQVILWLGLKFQLRHAVSRYFPAEESSGGVVGCWDPSVTSCVRGGEAPL